MFKRFQTIEFINNQYDELGNPSQMIINVGGKVSTLSIREARHLVALIYHEIGLDVCECCNNLGYLDVAIDGDEWEIQACQECNAFTEGSMGDATNADTNAQYAASIECAI